MKCPDANNMPYCPTVKITKRNLVAKWDTSDMEGYDDIDMDNEWVCMQDSITETMKNINPKSNTWYCLGYNLGWQHKDGVMPDFKAEDGQQLLNKILPKTECSFKVIKQRNKLIIINSHHDAMGEVYVVVPVR